MPVVRYDAEPTWSLDALTDVGVPEDVVDRLRRRRPANDLQWTSALAEVLAETLPPAAPPGPGADLCVSGHGAASAVRIIRAGLEGFTPGVISVDGREAPASATELALAVRALLPR
jgi:hypothetical protein